MAVMEQQILAAVAVVEEAVALMEEMVDQVLLS
jgi:hypothetical protein